MATCPWDRGELDVGPVEERLFLIEAADIPAARLASIAIGEAEEAAGSKDLEWNGQRARLEFMAVREIRRIFNASSFDMTADQLVHGMELTRNMFTLSDYYAAKRLALGEPALPRAASARRPLAL